MRVPVHKVEKLVLMMGLFSHLLVISMRWYHFQTTNIRDQFIKLIRTVSHILLSKSPGGQKHYETIPNGDLIDNFLLHIIRCPLKSNKMDINNREVTLLTAIYGAQNIVNRFDRNRLIYRATYFIRINI